jgi:hypothetical protein
MVFSWKPMQFFLFKNSCTYLNILFFWGPPRVPRCRRSLGKVRPLRQAPDQHILTGQYFYPNISKFITLSPVISCGDQLTQSESSEWDESTYTRRWHRSLPRCRQLQKVVSYIPTFQAGLPDFSWYSIPKRREIYQITLTIPNGNKI